ncbi:MAG: DUF4249 domain-containing protein [Flavobacteriales bacterium]|nr:DUF4249 domain-containing protein [Flavobacteriales bacterium]
MVLILLTITFLGCTEELDLDLNSSDPQVVVEANISSSEGTQVLLTSSVNFDDDNDFPVVTLADVTIEVSDGNTYNLPEMSPGRYEMESLICEPSKSYDLEIQTGSKLITARCVVPTQVPFDSLIVEKIEGETAGGPGGGFGNGTQYRIKVQYNDPAGQPNYYRFVVFKNGSFESSTIFDDRLSDGQVNTNTLLSFGINLSSGDSLEVKMQCIDENVYDYYNSFGNLFGGPTNASTPANPYTNLNGTKLGYFSAHTSESKSQIIPN